MLTPVKLASQSFHSDEIKLAALAIPMQATSFYLDIIVFQITKKF